MTDFEQSIQKDLHAYLLMEDRVGQILPDAPDIEQKWEVIAQAYLPDGIREYTGYPTVSLGWMMYVGMALAAMWDEDWESCCSHDDIYAWIRDQRGYDAMDEFVREEILHLEGEEYQKVEKIVGECAARTNSNLRRAPFEPGTKEAFEGYVASLHQLYLMGAAIQLKAMGYNMVKMN